MRVLSLLPSATEIVAALGAIDSLVGVSHACDYPPAIARLPRVTRTEIDAHAEPHAIDADVRRLVGEGRSLYDLDEATIRALHPDVILTQALCDVCAVLEGDVHALAARLQPPPRVISLSTTTLDRVFEDVARVGAALGAEDEASELLAGLRARVGAVHQTLRTDAAPRPAVAVIEWSDPVFAAGHWVPEMVRRAGGRDVLANAGQHSVAMELKALTDASPEIVLIAPCGYDLARAEQESHALLASSDWRVLRGRQVWALDANALTSRPGPRLVDGVEVMARIFNPQLFTPLAPGRATRIA